MSRPRLAGILLAILTTGIPALAVGAEKSRAHEYTSMWDPDPGSEHMWLGEDTARFSQLKGHMVLSYAGIMPAENESSDPNIKIYRILNAKEFLRLNKGNNEYPCGKTAVRWLGVSNHNGPGDPKIGDYVRINFYDIADYRAYREDKAGECASYPYRRTGE